MLLNKLIIQEAVMEVLKAKVQAQSPLLVHVDVHEIFSHEMWRATLTELVGTAAFMFTVSTLVVSCLESHDQNPKLLVSLGVAVTLFLFLVTLIPISGGHLNPTFSCIAAIKGLVSPTRAVAYVLAQCVGSVVGFLAVRSVTSEEIIAKYSLGGCTVSVDGLTPELDVSTAFMLEFTCAFVLLFIGVTLGFDQQRCKEHGTIAVCAIMAATLGILVFVSVMVTGSTGYAGVGLNPARCLGPALLMGGRLWHGHWVFWLGPFLACVVYYAYSITGLAPKSKDQDDVTAGQTGDESMLSKPETGANSIHSNPTVYDPVETV